MKHRLRNVCHVVEELMVVPPEQDAGKLTPPYFAFQINAPNGIILVHYILSALTARLDIA